MVRKIYQLRVALDGVTPPVWRRVQVPGAFTLDRIHRVIQYAMGWRDYHLHSFDIGGAQYGEPDPDGDLDLVDELEVRLDAVATEGTRLRYTYDYGDWWEHTVDVEEVLAADPDERYPLCLEGAGICPPEDVGGAFGYAEAVAVLHDPAHPEYAAVRERFGGVPESFDPRLATTLLRRLA
ncbi:plasmid pRiA4b ORF-3 family protein [Luedemannella flava]|uniref:Plasmid pRiA4b ORF-3 family protein n=1 Tax=Luedemannella flava TaxID=349316 RepID=A0ABP4Z1T7_9ACTN